MSEDQRGGGGRGESRCTHQQRQYPASQSGGGRGGDIEREANITPSKGRARKCVRACTRTNKQTIRRRQEGRKGARVSGEPRQQPRPPEPDNHPRCSAVCGALKRLTWRPPEVRAVGRGGAHRLGPVCPRRCFSSSWFWPARLPSSSSLCRTVRVKDPNSAAALRCGTD